MMHMNDFDLITFSNLDQDELLQRTASLHEVLSFVRGESTAFEQAGVAANAAEEELVRRAMSGSYKTRPAVGHISR